MNRQTTVAEVPDTLQDVQAVYSGPEGQLWELVMGQQIHIGGLQSSSDLAQRAGIEPGMRGVDFCCATGAGMRFLVRFRGVANMTGVDATRKMVQAGRRRCREEGLADRIRFIQGDACDCGLPAGQFDFVWGEDAWCYVEHKADLVQEGVRLLRPGGLIAFTDWMIGPRGLSGEEAERFFRFMKFPNLFRLEEYSWALRAEGCELLQAMDTGRFAGHARLYLEMLQQQLTYDALKLLNFDSAAAEALLGELAFTQNLARVGQVIQGLVVAQKCA